MTNHLLRGGSDLFFSTTSHSISTTVQTVGRLITVPGKWLITQVKLQKDNRINVVRIQTGRAEWLSL